MTRLEKWRVLANTNLLNHIKDQASKGVHYTDAGRNTDTAESYELTRPLVDYKNAWARDMLDYEQEHGKISDSEGKRQWDACMARAEQEIDQVRLRYAAGMAA